MRERKLLLFQQRVRLYHVENDRFFEERKTAFTPKIAAALLKSGKATVKKLYSPKTGKTYDGTVLLADTGGKYVNYKVTISKNKELE